MATQKKSGLTPKQAEVKANSLLRGIDNSIATIKKNQQIIEDNTKEIRGIVTGLGNQAQATPKPAAKPAAAKPATAKPDAKVAKPAAKPAAKKAVMAKPAKAAKPAKPAKAAKPAKEQAAKPAKPAKAASGAPSQDGPTIKEAAIEVLRGGGKMKAADIWHQAQTKFGRTWSRQVLYNALNKNPQVFKKTGDEFELAAGAAKAAAATHAPAEPESAKAPVAASQSGKEEEVDAFVKKAAETRGVQQVI